MSSSNSLRLSEWKTLPRAQVSWGGQAWESGLLDLPGECYLEHSTPGHPIEGQGAEQVMEAKI